jgi:phosphoenolpyruvate carboxykinase (ATP)
MLSKVIRHNQRLINIQTKAFSTPTSELLSALKGMGISKKMEVVYNPSVAQLYEYAMLPEHMESPDPTVGPSSITETGALNASSGLRTGRVPKDKRIVLDDETRDKVHWGAVNIGCSAESF